MSTETPERPKSAFEIGEIVRLDEFPLVRVADTSEVDCSELGVVLDCDSGSFPLTIPLGVVKVTRVAAGHWPPQAGDLWRARAGELWFATDVRDIDETDEPDIQLIPTYEGRSPWTLDRAVSAFGPFTLIHRDEQPDAAKAGDA